MTTLFFQGYFNCFGVHSILVALIVLRYSSPQHI